jgi:cysteine-rich repeat protein
METGCGDGFTCGAEACDDGNPTDGDGCDANCTMTGCGNGVVTAGEVCDDGNTMDCDGCRADCSAAETGCGDGFQCGAEACDDGNTTDCDGCRADCSAAESGCGDGFTCGAEACDDGNSTDGDGCDANCTPTGCGNGVVAGSEGCDDGNVAWGDGCSAGCVVEGGYTCAGSPSACALTSETNCNDGADDDGDGSADCADTDCALGCNPSVGPCAPGQTLLVFNAANLPANIEDNLTTASTITVGEATPVSRIAVGLDITHTYDADLDISLDSPGGAPINLASDLGGSGQNYTGTIFDTFCPSSIVAGTAPFTGCFRPQASLVAFSGTPSQGGWTLGAADDADGDTGTLNSWSLALCVAPATCGDGATDAGEQCDDGNAINDDACTNACLSPQCTDGLLQAGSGEECDDANAVNGDCCSSACLLELGCESEPNNVCAQPDGPLSPSPSAGFNAAISPVGDQDFVAFTVPAAANVSIETFSGASPGACTGGIDTVIYLVGTDCMTVLATDDQDGLNSCSKIDPAMVTDAGARQLPPGTYYVRIEDYLNNSVITAYNVVITLTSLCGNGNVQPFEGCDDGGTSGGDGCSALCQVEQGWGCTGNPSTCVFTCGDGVINGTDQCDDGGTSGGDGCSDVCTIEPDYACTGEPSVCSQLEVLCNDGIDNDGDGDIDLLDIDCGLGGSIAACGAGEVLYVYNATDVPKAIPDLSAGISTIAATHPGTVTRAVLRLSISHTYDGDLDISFRSPTGPTIDLSSDNGASNDNYTNTIFDNACPTPITSGTAPFSGCFSPEQSLGAYAGQSAVGTWTLTAADDSAGIAGTLDTWSLALCVTP